MDPCYTICTGLVYTPFTLYAHSMLVLLYNGPYALYDIAKMDDLSADMD